MFELVDWKEGLSTMICPWLSWDGKHRPEMKALAGKIYMSYPRLWIPRLLGMTLRN